MSERVWKCEECSRVEVSAHLPNGWCEIGETRFRDHEGRIQLAAWCPDHWPYTETSLTSREEQDTKMRTPICYSLSIHCDNSQVIDAAFNTNSYGMIIEDLQNVIRELKDLQDPAEELKINVQP